MMKTSKILMVVGAVALMMALVVVLTNPGKQKHMAAIMAKSGLVEEGKVEERSRLDALGQMMGVAMLDRMLEVRSFLFFSTGRVMFEGESRLVTIGALGHVFFLGREQEEPEDEEEERHSSGDAREQEEGSSGSLHREVNSFDPYAEEENSAGSWTTEASARARFEGCSSVRLSDVIGHWVSDASECGSDGGLWITMVDGNMNMSGWEWSGTLVASLQGSDRTTVQLKIHEEREPHLMQVEMGKRNGNLVLDPAFRNYCCGNGGGVLVRCPSEATTTTSIGKAPLDGEKVNEPAAPAVEKAEPPVFTTVEEMPSFPGGDAELSKYLGRTVGYPSAAQEAGISGVVYMTFVVDEDGKVRDPKVLRGIGGGCDEEAIRVVKAMPAWNAGKQRGKPVRVQHNLPIRFAKR